MPTHEIYNAIRVNDHLTTGGQPTAEQIRDAAREGFNAVINLATYHPGESLEDEAGLVRSLGMAYYAIPVVWSAPQASDFAAFEALLEELGPSPRVLLHCAANYRVSAFYSLYAWKHLGWSEAQALAFRERIWAGSEYPAWQALIAGLSQAIRESFENKNG